MYGLTLTTAATSEPLTLNEVKRGLDLSTDVNQRDEMLQMQLSAARQIVQDRTNRQFVNATWTLKLDGFPASDCPIYLPRSPLSSVTTIHYLESAAGASTLWASSNYRVSTAKEPGEVSLANGVSWPSIYPVDDAVTIVFVAGYGASATSVPANAKMAILMQMKLLLGWWASETAAIERCYESLVTGLEIGDGFHKYAVEAYP